MNKSDELRSKAAVIIEEMRHSGKYLMDKNFKYKKAQETNVAETFRRIRKGQARAKI